MQSISVDLPLPEAPTIAVNCPRLRSNEVGFSALIEMFLRPGILYVRDISRMRTLTSATVGRWQN